ncbi:TRAP-type mannitol/chloroaromatic compound transport system, periplasmic component [Rubidibacter lacunae KORDI 51-2]|uniref:TRAP-type mannitol/chloroaromatic compound transport system, periplasmic component n=1 Tax=Rubidibacter lacunae KORDI 51-2 TaxID=582515 RepID=U5DP31_9CHRO|nr:hypothetical protein [Rubidibacter lacunae]ERN42369.1 TRAP-type mannitol/chloroaromatic compound transport system, periplasmic component [Rubidibacter lacunae KORDI 51-2]
MKRRRLIADAAVGAAGTVAIAACTRGNSGGGSSAPAMEVDDRKNVRWRMASSYTPAIDVLYGGSERFAERVRELTDGRFEIAISASGEIVPGLEILDAVQQGTVQSGHTASYFYRGKNEALAFDTAVPFGLNYRQQTAWMYEGGGLDLIHSVLADFNIISFPGGNTGTQMGGWWKERNRTPADLNGKNMRIPGLGGVVMERLGVNVQTLAAGEILQALQLGAIDAAEFAGPYDDEKLGLYKVANLYYYPGWWEPSGQASFYFNLNAWNELPSSYRLALQTAAAEAHTHIMASYDARNPEALQRLVDRGVELVRFSDEIMTSARQIAFDLYEEIAAKDKSYQKVYQAWQQFRSNSNRWFSTSELSYTDFSVAGGPTQ